MNLTLRQVLDRYGPILALILVLVMLAVFLPGNDDDSGADLELGATSDTSTLDTVPPDTSDPGAAVAPDPGVAPSGDLGGAPSPAAPSAGGPSAGGSTGGAPAPSPGRGRSSPTTRAGASSPATAAPGGAAPASVPGCRPDGRMNAFSVYMPPCVPVFAGDNGGSTYQGVTEDKILVVRYMSQIDPATSAVLRGLNADDGVEKNLEMDTRLVRFYNLHSETYGREVIFRTFNATAPDDDDAGVKRDAVKIATEIKPFAVWYTPPSAPSKAFAEELAARGVMCLCTTSQVRSFYKRTSPYVWSSLPVLEEYYQHLAEYIGKRLAGKPAKHAGDPVLQATPRKFGLIYVEGNKGTVDPGAREAYNYYVNELAKYGVKLTKVVSYTFDLARGQEQATGIMAGMRDAGVSNLLCVCDPLYPIFFTRAATQQAYFPEHLISGTGLIDSSFFGRTYDPAQWRHAFGIGPLWVFFTDVSTSSGYKAYHHMKPGAPKGDEGAAINVRQAPIQLLFHMVQLAGPKLTPQNVQKGMLGWPRTGGTPKLPLVYYTPESPNQIKDFTEVFWNPNGSGKDETGRDGVGTLMKAENGRRYQAGQWERKDPKIFTTDGAVFTSDNPPESFAHDADGHRHKDTERCRSC